MCSVGGILVLEGGNNQLWHCNVGHCQEFQPFKIEICTGTVIDIVTHCTSLEQWHCKTLNNQCQIAAMWWQRAMLA